MMQKDEKKLLEPWILYYSSLFGIANLTVLDNGSTNKRCLELLKKYESFGLNVLWNHSRSKDFVDKGEIIGGLIKAMDSEGVIYDFALALDCDEFIAAVGSRVSLKVSDIHEALNALVDRQEPIVLTDFFNNVPNRGGWFTCEHVPKAIIVANSLESLDHGFHHPVTKRASRTHTTSGLAHIHLHNRSLMETRAFAQNKLAPYLDVNDLAAIAEWTGPGLHLTKYFFLTEEEYSLQFSGRTIAMLPQVLERFQALKISIADTLQEVAPCGTTQNVTLRAPDGEIVDFDPIAWMKKRPDVAAAGLGPLFHFAKYGLEEERSAKAEAIVSRRSL